MWLLSWAGVGRIWPTLPIPRSSLVYEECPTQGPCFYCHEECHFTWYWQMYCHFSVILSCKITMSQEITLFLTVETWTLIWSIILIFLGQGGGLGAVDPVRPELQKLIRVSLLKSKLCIRRIVLRNCHKQLRPHIRQVKCCYFIEKLCNQMWWIRKVKPTWIAYVVDYCLNHIFKPILWQQQSICWLVWYSL